MSPPLWIGLAHYGHLELAMALWFVLLGMRLLLRGRPAWAGFCLGLAVLTHTTTALVAIPMVLLPLMSRRTRTAMALAAVAAATVTAGLLPFLLTDARDVIQSFITYRAARPTLGGSFWLPILGVSRDGFVQHWDSVLLGGAALAIVGAALRFRPRAPWRYHAPTACSRWRPLASPC